MSSIIIDYSRTGKTKLVADIISKEINAEVIEIKDKTNRSGLIGFVKGTVDTIQKNKTPITSNKTDLAPYDTVYIGTPVWAKDIAPAIKQFIDNASFENKRAITFITMTKKFHQCP